MLAYFLPICSALMLSHNPVVLDALGGAAQPLYKVSGD